MTKYRIRGYIGVKSNDGHDAPILMVADFLKKGGIEVILGGYDLTVDKFVRGIIQEGVQFAGISSYNGGHVAFFKALRDELKKRNHPFIHLIGGGGAIITPSDIATLEKQDGIDKIFKKGEGHLIAPFVTKHYDFSTISQTCEHLISKAQLGDERALAEMLNVAEEKAHLESLLEAFKTNLDLYQITDGFQDLLNCPLGKDELTVKEALEKIRNLKGLLSKLDVPAGKDSPTVFGITGRGGSGKSTITDELILRFFNDSRTENKKVAVLAIDPSSNDSGGALLADRIGYMYVTDKTWVDVDRVFIRSVASRGYGRGIVRALPDMVEIFKASGYEVFVESYGTGQQDAGILEWVDKTVYVTTPDLGGAAQIAKEALLNQPGVFVVLNKNEFQGAKHVSSLLRSRIDPKLLFHTTAIEHRNPGVNTLYEALTRHYH